MNRAEQLLELRSELQRTRRSVERLKAAALALEARADDLQDRFDDCAQCAIEADPLLALTLEGSEAA